MTGLQQLAVYEQKTRVNGDAGRRPSLVHCSLPITVFGLVQALINWYYILLQRFCIYE